MVVECLRAHELLAEVGIQAEVIDPVWLAPLDIDTILQSVRKTGRLLVVHEAVRVGGFGAEVAATIQEGAFDYLDAPVLRVGLAEVPMPYSKVLERAAIPDVDRIVAAARRTLERRR